MSCQFNAYNDDASVWNWNSSTNSFSNNGSPERKRTSSDCTLPSATQAPAVILLESVQDGLLRLKVEPDIMAYILYCCYDKFANIQQTHNVTISWSGDDNSVLFCSTSSRDALPAAAQKFLDFYYDLLASVVACPLDNHIVNITQLQYHKATYEVKKHHQMVMMKEIKANGKLALYGRIPEVLDAKYTFLSALHSTAKKTMNGSKWPSCSFHLRTRFPDINFTSTEGTNSRLRQNHVIDGNLNEDFYNQNLNSSKGHHQSTHRSDDSEIFSRNTLMPYPGYGSLPSTTERIDRTLNVFEFDHQTSSQLGRKAILPSHRRTVFPDVNSELHETWKPNPDLNRNISQHSPHRQESHSFRNHLEISGPISVELASTSSFEEANKTTNMTKAAYKYPSRLYTMTYNQQEAALRHNKDLRLKQHATIPKLKSPFSFTQKHRKHFEVRTPTGVIIEVYEGDIISSDCDVVVNETNKRLDVTGELAWAVAKHGAFEITKQTKLHYALHGEISECKVVVTPSSRLPSLYIIHVVTPRWTNSEDKKGRRALYNTYKNVFNKAHFDLKAKSVAMPVIGLLGEHNEFCKAYPTNVAIGVMYQALVAFLKLGSITLQHVRYVCSNPLHCELVATAIGSKIENVTYDSRFLRHIHTQAERRMKVKGEKSSAMQPAMMTIEDKLNFRRLLRMQTAETTAKTLNRDKTFTT